MGPLTALRAIVVHHDQPRRCADTVEHLRRQGVELDVVVVDNASTRSARDAVASIEGVRILDSGGNLGYGGGANTALREWLADPGAGEWAVVMPHDAQPAPGCLRSMLAAAAAADDIGIASAEYGDDELPAVDKVFGAVTVAAPRGAGFADAGYAHGTFLLLRRACLADIGLFDESYFAYCEEADLALRARRVGWRTGIVWGSVVTNPHQGTPAPAVDYLMLRNTVVLVARHFGRYNAVVRFVIALLSLPWNAAGLGRRSAWFDVRARLYALRDLAIHRLGPPPPALLPR